MSFSVVTKNAEDFGLSLPQSASLTAPSSEGAFGRKTIIYEKLSPNGTSSRKKPVQRLPLNRSFYGACVLLYSASASVSQSFALASLGMRQSPRGLKVTEPTLTPSGRQLRLNCWVKNRR